MSSRGPLRALLRRFELLTGMVLALALASCGMGETMMPNPAPGLPADRSAGVVVPVPAPIPHSLDGRQECFACHAIGAVDAPPIPTGHDQDVELCTTCHAVWLAPAVAAAAAPAIPHELEDREDCLACHKVGTAGAPRIPGNHTSLTTALCQTCHTGLGALVGSGEETAGSVVEAPVIPHGLEGFSACTQCHAQGGGGVPRFPDDHQGRSDNVCSACHSPAIESPGVAPTEAPPPAGGDAVNGQTLYRSDCAPCHGQAGEGTSIAPAALKDATLLAQFTDEDLTTAIREGVGERMPAFPELSDQEILDLIALLRSWQ